MKRFTLLLVLMPLIALANGEVYSPNMNLPVPTVGVTTGPSYASDINLSLGILDAHDHSPGNGVPITPAGMNISSDLTCRDNNLTNVRSVRFFPQSSALSGAADLGAIYESGVDLYYNDGSGNHVRITQSGGVAGSPGSISNLNSPASAAYVSASGTFVWQQGSSVAANMDAATYILRYPGSYPSPSGNYIALQAPSTLATGFALTFPPTLPSIAGSFQTSDTSGNQSWTAADGSTIQVSSNVLSVQTGGINTAQLATGAVTAVKRTINLAQSATTGHAQSTAMSFATVVSVTITTSGKPVAISFQGDGSSAFVGIAAGSYVGIFNSAAANQSSSFQLLNGSTVVNYSTLASAVPTSSSVVYPPSIFNFIDTSVAGSPGTYTYSLQMKSNNSSQSTYFYNVIMSAQEL